MASRSYRDTSAARHIQFELDHGHFEGGQPKIARFAVVREPPTIGALLRIDTVNWTDPDTGEVEKETFVVNMNHPYQEGTLEGENSLQ